MKIRNQSSLPSKYWLLIIAFFCVVLMGIEHATGGNGPLTFIANYTIVPMQKGISYMGMWISDVSSNFETMEDMQKKNDELQKKVDDLTIDNTRLRQDQYELERLRELYKLDENYSDYQKVGAHVISNNGTNWFNDFTIDKGSNDGIKENCNVLAGSGLAGIVTEVGPDYARVRSIIDDSSRVGAMSLDSSYNCIVAGDLTLYEQGRLKLTDFSRDAVLRNGDQIITSNISTKYLPGILIGYAVDVSIDPDHLTQSGYLIPAADFDNLQEVLILTDLKNSDEAVE